jgi:hypothetical protein
MRVNVPIRHQKAPVGPLSGPPSIGANTRGLRRASAGLGRVHIRTRSVSGSVSAPAVVCPCVLPPIRRRAPGVQRRPPLPVAAQQERRRVRQRAFKRRCLGRAAASNRKMGAL